MKENYTNTKVVFAKTKFAELYKKDRPLQLDSGDTLDKITVAYQTYGRLNAEGTNVILVCHALTGNSHAAGIITKEEIQNSRELEFLEKYNKMYLGKSGWWDPLIGPGKVFDTEKYFIICSNLLGSCYGTTGPTGINDLTGQIYKSEFPDITIRDMVKVQKELMDYLNVNRIKIITGGSLGGMQVLEWAVMYGNFIDLIIPIATASAHSPWAVALNTASRSAITNDKNWDNGNYSHQPDEGLALARQIAMISYRSYMSFHKKFGREITPGSNIFEVNSYLDYQGIKFFNRFDANTYLYLSRAMDKHDLSLNRAPIKDVLASITNQALCIGIDSDVLYPPAEQFKIYSDLKNAHYTEIKSLHGHDAFLIEFEQIEKIFRNFMKGKIE